MFNQSALSVAVSLALAMPAYANDNNTQAASDSPEKLIVTATRTNSSLENTAASVAVISDQQIEQDLALNLEDVFRYVPGVTVNKNTRAGITDINIRGVEGNRVKILLDGVSQPLNFDSGGTFIQSSRLDLDLDLIKRVEILKGAASSISGGDALAGVVKFTTKDPADFLSGTGDQSGGHIKLGYSSASKTFTQSVALANRTGDWESMVAYTHQDGDEPDNFGTPSDQDSNANNVLVKLQYQLNDRHRIEFNGQYNRRDTDTDLDQTSQLYSPYNGNDLDKKTQIGLKHIWYADTTFFDHLQWQIAFIEKDKAADTNRTSLTSGNVQQKRYTYKEKGYEGDAQFNKSFETSSLSHELAYGFSFAVKDLENINNEYNSVGSNRTIFYVPDAKETRFGGFVQDQIAVSDWLITAGIRYDAYKTDTNGRLDESNLTPGSYGDYSDSAMTGRLGAVYALNEQHKFYGQISQGFRAPTFSELFYSFGNSGAFYAYQNVPNPDLDAEKSTAYEMGWRFNNDRSSAELSVFYSRYRDFIDQKLISGAGTPSDPSQYSYVNIDEATIKGIELSHRMNLAMLIDGADAFSTRFSAAYTEGEDGDDEALDSVSPWRAVAGLNYDDRSGIWGSSLALTYTAAKSASDVSSDYRSSNNYLPGSSTIVDLTAYYRPVDSVTLRAGVFNLTDKEYYHWNDVRGVSSTSDFQQYSQPERYFAVTAKYEF